MRLAYALTERGESLLDQPKPIGIGLDPQSIAEEAINLVNELGLQKLSIRTLAARLEISGPSIYWHFENKEMLLAKMAELLFIRTYENIKPTKKWEEWLRRSAISLRKVLLTVRDGAQIIVISPWTEYTLGPIREMMIQPLIAKGIPWSAAIEAGAAINSFTLGWTIHQQGPVGSSLAEICDVDEVFLHGLDALIVGLQLRYQTEFAIVPGR